MNSITVGGKRFVIVTSTGGSVMSELLGQQFFRSQIFSVVSDRVCPALDKAKSQGIPTLMIREKENDAFSSKLLHYLLENRIDYVISFFTRLFTDELVQNYRDRIINLHLSLLPSFTGFNAFERAFEYGFRFSGTTIHFVDESIDKGKIIIQTIRPIGPDAYAPFVRHVLFEHQCKALLQVTKWLVDERVEVHANKVIVRDAKYIDPEFSPSLDFGDAIRLVIPFPGG